MKPSRTRGIALCALFAALTALCSQIAIPIGPVPINLATFAVFCAGALLGAKAGCVSQIAYVLLGAVGAPVFSLFRGGFSVLAGPTGGYIVGYVVAAWLTGLLCDRSEEKTGRLALAMAAGFAGYMVPGTGWYMLSANVDLAAALMACVVPFLPGEAVKITAAVILARRLRPVLRARGRGV